jgi:hypothetical protein
MGQRGINDLIDREAMDNALFAHRQSLQRWNTLLEHITADRTALFCAGFSIKARGTTTRGCQTDRPMFYHRIRLPEGHLPKR